MILEVAILTIKDILKAEFKSAFTAAESIICGMNGYVSHSLKQCIEKDNQYILLVEWQTLEDHTIGFRQSPEYQDWKQLLHHFYDPFPEVEHYKSVLPHIKSTQPTLKTNRLILNAFTQADIPHVTAICSNKAIADTTAHIPHPYTEEIASEWISTHALSFNKKSSVTYAIRDKHTLDLIGCMSLAIDQVSDRGELGYWIREEAWSKGYCTEAAQVIIPFGFNKLQLNKLKAEHLTRNTASGKVLQKLGFKKEGILKQHFKKWGIFEDIAVYGLLKSDNLF